MQNGKVKLSIIIFPELYKLILLDIFGLLVCLQKCPRKWS